MKTTPGTGSPVPRIGGKHLDHRFDYCSRRLLRRYHSPCTVQLQIVQKVIKLSFLKCVCVNLSQLTALLDFFFLQISDFLVELTCEMFWKGKASLFVEITLSFHFI